MQTWAEETTDLNSCCWLLILRSALVSNREELEQALRVSLPILQPITYKKTIYDGFSNHFLLNQPARQGSKPGSHRMVRSWAPWSQIPGEVLISELSPNTPNTLLPSNRCRMACPIFLLARTMGCSTPPPASSSTRGNFSVRKRRRLRTYQGTYWAVSIELGGLKVWQKDTN